MSAFCLILAALVLPAQTSSEASPPNSALSAKMGLSRHGFALPNGGRVLREGLWHPVEVEITAEQPVAGGVLRLVAEGFDPWGVPAKSERVLPALVAGVQKVQCFSPLAGTWTKPVRVWLEEVSTGKRLASARPAEDEVRILGTGSSLVLVAGRGLPELNRALFNLENPNLRKKEGEEGEVEPAAGLVNIINPSDFPESHLGYGGVDLVVMQPDLAWLETWLAPKNAGRRQALALWLARGGKLVVGTSPNIWPRLEELGRELGVGGESAIPVTPVAGLVERRLPVSGLSRWVGGNLPPLAARMLPGWQIKTEADALAAEPVPGQPTRPVLVQTGAGRGWLLVSAFELEGVVADNASQEKEIWLAFWKKILGEHGLPRLQLASGSPLMDELSDTGMGVLPFGWVVILSLLFMAIAGPLDYLFTAKVLGKPEATWWTLPLVAMAAVAGAMALTKGLHGEGARHRQLDLVDLVVSATPGKKASWAGGSTFVSLVDPKRSTLDWRMELEPEWLGETDQIWAGPGGPWLHEDRTRPGPVLPARQGYTFGNEAAEVVGIPVGPGSERLFRADWLARLQEPSLTARLAPSRTSGSLEGVVESNLPVDLENVVLVWAGRATPVGDLPGRGGRVRVEIHRVGDAGDTAETWRLKTHQEAGYVAGTARTGIARGEFKRDLFSRFEPFLFARPEAEDILRATGLGWDQSWRLRQVAGQWRREAVLVGRVVQGEGPTSVKMVGDLAGVQGTGERTAVLRAFLPVEAADTAGAANAAGGNGR